MNIFSLFSRWIKTVKKIIEDEAALQMAYNPNTPTATLMILAKREYGGGEEDSWKLLKTVALHPNATVEVLEVLMSKKHFHTDRCIAGNRNASESILRRLAKDTNDDQDVRRNVAKHPNTPADVLNVLAGYGDRWTRYNVAGNPNTPKNTLDRLTRDSDGEVMRRAQDNPNIHSWGNEEGGADNIKRSLIL